MSATTVTVLSAGKGAEGLPTNRLALWRAYNFAFSALTLLVGRQEGHLARKN